MSLGDIVIQDREELFFLLCEAAEFEHAVMCSYLYAMWTLKRDVSEGVTAEELTAIDGWRRSLRQVALEEMLHLSLVNNLLAATGASPHLWRPPFPVASGWFPSDVIMRLSPFEKGTIDHFLFIERPEGIDMSDGAGFDHPSRHPRVARPDLLSPTPRDYASQGQLYHAIIQGLARLVEQHGEAKVFVGHGEAQVGAAEFGLPGLFKVNNLADARRAIEEIVTQGEGAPAHNETSHYARFAAIGREYDRLKEARPDFRPARPVVENPALDNPRERQELSVICDPLTSKVIDLGNALYALMMRTFAQVFSPAPLPRELRVGLSLTTTELMYAMSAVGEAATRLPVGPAHAGKTGGLTFALPMSSGQLVQRCAAQILSERVAELAGAATKLEETVPLMGAGKRLEAVAARLADLHVQFEEHLTTATEALVQPKARLPAATTASATDDPNIARTTKVTLRFNGQRCIHSRHCVLGAPSVFLANVKGPWLHPESVSVEECAAVAHNCPSGAITYERHDGGPQEEPPKVNVLHIRENGPYAVHATIALGGQGNMFRATLCRCGKSRNKPFCDNTHRDEGFAATGEPATIETDPLQQRDGALAITPLEDGPLQVNGSLEICSGTGRTISRVENARLCRCGGSANKPFCDGTHARIGFRSAPSAAAKPHERPVG
ncbi:MAG: CDGSH iron-sulfur domain-containing protein [Alphaproteobacteria bacterium]|nr:CDGSH iron-sulfur domain-containing protein [Alphaproteobacteria bacterium]MBL6939409.1 CDGSH iron-sulfur domain-containing protein [Alphaproteobacteria bacterium]MBL7097110.1 CDGSH iron-sulfur domain-containing protein [Alphaproteobacteria bacterium]